MGLLAWRRLARQHSLKKAAASVRPFLQCAEGSGLVRVASTSSLDPFKDA